MREIAGKERRVMPSPCSVLQHREIVAAGDFKKQKMRHVNRDSFQILEVREIRCRPSAKQTRVPNANCRQASQIAPAARKVSGDGSGFRRSILASAYY